MAETVSEEGTTQNHYVTGLLKYLIFFSFEMNSLFARLYLIYTLSEICLKILS